MSDIWATAAQLQQKILEPRSATDQAAGIRAMLLLIEALFAKGRISAEAYDLLIAEYSRMLHRLWKSDEMLSHFIPPVARKSKNETAATTEVEADVVQPPSGGSRCRSSFTREQIRQMIKSQNESNKQERAYLDSREIKYALENAFIKSNPQETQLMSSSSADSSKDGQGAEGQTDQPFDIVTFVKSLEKQFSTMATGPSTASSSAKASTASPKAILGPFSSAKDRLEEEMVKSGKMKKSESSDVKQCSDSDLLNGPLKCIDSKLIEIIKNEIMTIRPQISWDDIAGLKFAKQTVIEMVVWPLLRPDIFKGVREPPKGLLLFGPPGTGKTLIGKCIAAQANATFFSISASSLTSKWVGEGEKLVRALFTVARNHQPSVVFVDEIDSLLSQRSVTEHESSRKMKTEFLVQMDGAHTHKDANRMVIIGATNRPQELDEAARRRMVKRIYLPLPTMEARRFIVSKLVSSVEHCLSDADLDCIAQRTDGPVAGPNFREDELQAERGEEIVQLLLAAGYFRARIKGLSLFDKVVGGLVWCIQICAVDIEVELLFNENWNIGTKIALTEKIVRALRELQCPHPIEPHQIQGKDHIHVFPVVQWLVKRALETREQTAQYHSRFAQYQLEKNYGIALTSQPKPVEVYRPVRTYRHIAPDTLSKELLLDAVLLEYSQKETTGGQDDERSSAIAGEMRSVDHVSEVSQNIEEGTEKLKKLVGRREKEISEGVDEWRELRDGEEDEMERRKNRVLKEIGWRERRLEELREKVKERREEVKSARRRMEETREEAQRMRALKEKENEEKAFLDVCESLQVLDEMKKQEGEFKKECRRELERLQQMVAEEQRQGEDGGEESQAGDERIEQEFAQVSQMKVKIAKLNRQVGKLQRAIDQIPTRSELGQFQRRFVELHQQMADVHKETKQYYTMFNTMNDLCAYLEKEIGLLNSIQDNFTQAMGSSASREMFLGQVEASVQGIRQNRLKTEKRRHEAKMERDKLQYEYLRLVEKQRLYVKMVADFKEELRRNQALMASKSQQPLTE